MSLKVRLTLFYSSIVGGILILFSVAIYILVSATLVSQIDETLERTWFVIQTVVRVSSTGEIETTSEVPLDPNVFVQTWGRDGSLKYASLSVNRLTDPLDPSALQETQPVFRNSFVDSAHLRVLSVPLLVGDRRYGTMQIGASMAVVDGTQQELLVTLSGALLIAVVSAGSFGWLSTQNALKPLEHATRSALQITKTNDLSRRIPHSGPQGDEVDQLVSAFNQNLSRLERLIETQRRFVADVGHELRTPLTVIKGNVSLMRRFGELDEESLIGIQDEVDRMTRLVGDLMLLAQVEAGRLPMENKPVELDTVLLEVVNQSSVLAQEKITLKIEKIDQAQVCGDRDRLKQVLINLISNGIKYTPAGGSVTVALEKDEKMAYLSVSDDGPGIPKEDLPHIFERFYRGEKSRRRTKDGKGFGLGLSIAYWIVVNHNGRIEVNSNTGVGTRFCVNLPLMSGECVGDLIDVFAAGDEDE